MNETGGSSGINPFEKTLSRVKSRYYESQGLYPLVSPDDRRNLASEKRAKESVKQYLRTSSQEPLATFLGESESTIDLSNYPQGTIIRVEQFFPKSATPDEPSYSWYAIGDSEKDSTYIYDVHFFDGSYKSNSATLPTNSEPQLYAPFPLKPHPFPVRNAAFILSLQEGVTPEHEYQQELEDYHKHMPVSKVDIMAMGKTDKPRIKLPEAEIKSGIKPVGVKV